MTSATAELPVSERIAASVFLRLQKISAGYASSSPSILVWRPTQQGGFIPNDYQLIVTQGDMTHNQALSHMGNPPAKAWVLPFIISGLSQPSEHDPTAIDTLKNVFAADVTRCLCDADDWHTWDQMAIDSTIGNVQNIPSADGGISGFKLTLTILFRTDETNPYNVRA